MSNRRAQNAVRDQLVAAAVAERPRRRRRTTVGIAVVAALLGATAVADATGLLASGEPIETLLPRNERAWAERYEAPHGTRVVVTAPDADYRFGWGVGIYTTAKGEDCALAGQVLGARARPRTRRALPPLRAARDRLLRRPGPAGDDVRLPADHRPAPADAVLRPRRQGRPSARVLVPRRAASPRASAPAERS